MKTRNTAHSISVTLINSISLEMRELEFLREMARFCVQNEMVGCNAAERLDKLLESMGVNSQGKGPVYGIFEWNQQIEKEKIDLIYENNYDVKIGKRISTEENEEYRKTLVKLYEELFIKLRKIAKSLKWKRIKSVWVWIKSCEVSLRETRRFGRMVEWYTRLI